MEPDWNEAPEWANYWAMDQNGDARWYEKCPDNDYYDGYWCAALGSKSQAYEDKSDWKESLRKRP